MRIILILFNFSFIISRMIIPIFGEGKFLGGRLLSNYFQFNSKDCKWNYDDFPLEPFLFLLRKKEEAERKIDFLIIIEKDDLLLRPSPLHDHIYLYGIHFTLRHNYLSKAKKLSKLGRFHPSFYAFLAPFFRPLFLPDFLDCCDPISGRENAR